MITVALDSGSATAVFDRTLDALLHHDVFAGMDALRACLRRIRASLSPERWAAFGEHARQHPLHRLLLESPFTHRAFAKPRGYAGDAVLMDLIYGTMPPEPELTPLGGMLYGYEFDSPCCHSVRARRAILAREIDEIAAARSGARVLSVACGHLREIEWSRAARSGRVAITALDQDRESLGLIDEQYRRYGVSTLPGTVGDVLRRVARFRDLDLVYAAGLFDYLNAEVARALTSAMVRMLAPGGRLLIANFTPDTADAAFMETFMDWRLVYRDEADMRLLLHGVAPADVDSLEQFRDDNGHVTYLRLVRR